MRNAKIVTRLCDLFNVSREEMVHILNCHRCEFEDGGYLYLCWAAREEFRGEKKPDPNDPLSKLIQKIWAKEVLEQCAPVLRFDQFNQGRKPSAN